MDFFIFLETAHGSHFWSVPANFRFSGALVCAYSLRSRLGLMLPETFILLDYEQHYSFAAAIHSSILLFQNPLLRQEGFCNIILLHPPFLQASTSCRNPCCKRDVAAFLSCRNTEIQQSCFLLLQGLCPPAVKQRCVHLHDVTIDFSAVQCSAVQCLEWCDVTSDWSLLPAHYTDGVSKATTLSLTLVTPS